MMATPGITTFVRHFLTRAMSTLLSAAVVALFSMAAHAVEIQDLGTISAKSHSATSQWDLSISWGGMRRAAFTAEDLQKMTTTVSESPIVESAQVFSWGKEGERSLVARVLNHKDLPLIVQQLLLAVPHAAIIVRQPLSGISGIECRVFNESTGYHRCMAVAE